MSMLRYLDVSGNNIRTLPKKLGHCKQLHKLELSNNSLTMLPDSIRLLEKLENLYLHGNNSLGIPDEVLGPKPFDVAIRDKKPAKPATIIDYYFSTRNELGSAPS